jgi:hypothetical protein
MIARFMKYRRGQSGMFSPGENVYIHSIQQRHHPRYKGIKYTDYVCTKTADAEAARADPNLDNVQTEVLSRRQLGRDPKVALTTDRSVAEYWACLAAESDQRNNPEVESSAVGAMARSW